MMYSQQEYDMVRRQTMQIEAEKRALLRWALIGVTLFLAGSLMLTGWMYTRYSAADGEVQEALTRARNVEAQNLQVNRELTEKKSILEKNATSLGRQNEIIQTTIPKLLNRTARDQELGEFAHAVFQQPGHIVELPSMPPDGVLRSYRIRVENRPLKYTLIAGMLDGKWYLYSLLIKNQEDR